MSAAEKTYGVAVGNYFAEGDTYVALLTTEGDRTIRLLFGPKSARALAQDLLAWADQVERQRRDAKVRK